MKRDAPLGDFGDHFQFEQQIRCSKTSSVARDEQDERTRLRREKVRALVLTDTQRAEYKREVEAAAMLPEHPSIVRYYRSWQKEQLFYIQMEHCACGSLAGVLARLPQRTLLDETDVWRLARASRERSIAHMHDHGVLHLDIKPDNIYIDIDGAYKIGDLGLAYARGRGWDWEEGDGGYVAPELLNMFPARSRRRARMCFLWASRSTKPPAGRPFPVARRLARRFHRFRTVGLPSWLHSSTDVSPPIHRGAPLRETCVISRSRRSRLWGRVETVVIARARSVRSCVLYHNKALEIKQSMCLLCNRMPKANGVDISQTKSHQAVNEDITAFFSGIRTFPSKHSFFSASKFEHSGYHFDYNSFVSFTFSFRSSSTSLKMTLPPHVSARTRSPWTRIAENRWFLVRSRDSATLTNINVLQSPPRGF